MFFEFFCLPIIDLASMIGRKISKITEKVKNVGFFINENSSKADFLHFFSKKCKKVPKIGFTR